MQRTNYPISEQYKDSLKRKKKSKQNHEIMISTGSTLLDQAISGGVSPKGGIPGGKFVEISGPNGCGKTVIICEIAGDILRGGGKVLFNDPEARLDETFAELFGVDIKNKKKIKYVQPDEVTETFRSVRKFEPEPVDKIHGIMVDSLAALSTKMEMEGEDKMGARRAKEFSQELRKTCRLLRKRNQLMVCSNQLRDTMNAGPYGPKQDSPGGLAIKYYASIRLRCTNPRKIVETKTLKIGKKKKKIEKVVGVMTDVQVIKNSVWEPYHTATIYIIFDYGVDDIRANLQYVKDMTASTQYVVGRHQLGQSMNKAIQQVEKLDLKDELQQQVKKLWWEVRKTFKVERKPKYGRN